VSGRLLQGVNARTSVAESQSQEGPARESGSERKWQKGRGRTAVPGRQCAGVSARASLLGRHCSGDRARASVLGHQAKPYPVCPPFNQLPSGGIDRTGSGRQVQANRFGQTGSCGRNRPGPTHQPGDGPMHDQPAAALSSSSSLPTSNTSAIRPALARTLFSISWAMAGLASMNLRAFSRPWPMRSEL